MLINFIRAREFTQGPVWAHTDRIGVRILLLFPVRLGAVSDRLRQSEQ